MKIGLTGGIACGKSTVSQMLVDLGAVLVDADQLARVVVLPGEPGWLAVKDRFGEGILQPDGTLDRKKLGEIVFADKQARTDLQNILHPLIRSKMWERVEYLEQQDPNRLVVVDIPLLYESRLESNFDFVVVVYVDRDTQVGRLKKRDGLTDEEAEERLKAQMPIEQKKEKADWVIDNRGTVDETVEQVKTLWDRLHD